MPTILTIKLLRRGADDLHSTFYSLENDREMQEGIQFFKEFRLVIWKLVSVEF